MSMIDLSGLPAPEVIETLDFETILSELKSDLIARFPAESQAAIAATLGLESEPLTKLLQVCSYREVVLRSRINNTAISNILSFSKSSDLDHLAAFYGVFRHDKELDDRLRLRVQLQIAGLAGNGTREQYRAKALAMSDAVVDADVLQPAAGYVDVVLWISGEYNPYDVLESIRAAFAADDVRTLGVLLSVRQAQARQISVTATIYREKTAPVDLAQHIETAFSLALTDYAKLGRDVPRSWLLSKLHVAGVSRVELSAPASDVTMAPDEYATAGTMTITDGGVAW